MSVTIFGRKNVNIHSEHVTLKNWEKKMWSLSSDAQKSTTQTSSIKIHLKKYKKLFSQEKKVT